MRDLGPTLRVIVVAVLSTTCLTLGFASIGGAAPVAHSPVPGYWLIGADGGVFSFNAPFFGSTATECAASQFPAICASAIASTPDGGGYTIVSPFDIPFPLAQSQPAVATQFGDATGNADCSVHFNAGGGPASLLSVKSSRGGHCVDRFGRRVLAHQCGWDGRDLWRRRLLRSAWSRNWSFRGRFS